MDCYVYYKTAQEHQSLLLCQAERMSEILLAQTGITFLLQRRPDVTDGLVTWMEVYRQVPDDFEILLMKIISQTEMMPLIKGERYVEYFVDAITCA